MKFSYAFVFSIAFFLTQASIAQASHNVVCESRGGYHFCRAPIKYRSEVRFVQKISKARCNEGYSWGVTRGGIWVDRGCRAEFELVRRGGSFGYYPSGHHGHHHDHGNCSDHNHGHPGSWWGGVFGAPPKPNGHGYHKPLACPAGARPGRCTQKQRRKGCKDFRTASGLGCMTYR